MNIDIQYNNKAVLSALNRLSRSVRDMRPVMREIAGHLADGVEESFRKEQSPEGKVWKKRKPATLKGKAYRRRKPKKILQLTGHLVRSINSEWSATEAVVRTNVIYAKTHQFGRDAIPARPFLGVSMDTETTIKKTISEYLRK